MYVCVCRAVTERQIGEAVRAGARTLKDLRHALGVASECGQCATAARQCLEEARQRLLPESTPTADQRLCFIEPT
jgi:bacterioferritin-associated ferredoxin